MTTILERLGGIIHRQADESQRLRATAQEAVDQLSFGTEDANVEGLLKECGLSAETAFEVVALRKQRRVDRKAVDAGEVAIQERAALAIEEKNDIAWFEARRAEFDVRQHARNARAQDIESRVLEAAQARKRLAQTYRDPEIDATLTRCHARLREVVDGMRQLQDQITARTTKLKLSRQSGAPDAAAAVAISERMLEEYQATMAELTAEKQDLQIEINAAELAKLDPMAVKI